MKNLNVKNKICYLNKHLVSKPFVQNWNKLQQKKSNQQKIFKKFHFIVSNSVLFGNNVLMRNVIVFVNKLLNYKENMMNNHDLFLIDLKQQPHRTVITFRYLSNTFYLQIKFFSFYFNSDGMFFRRNQLNKLMN